MTCILGSAHAQDKDPNKWNSTLGIYLWATGIEGTTQTGPVTAPIDITFSDALDNLASVLTLHYEAQKNQWGVLADFMHIGLDPSAALPGGASLNIDLTNNIAELGGLYQPSSSENFQFLFGLRYTKLELEGSVPGIGGRSIVDESWTDGFIGGRFQVPFGNSEKWQFTARGDVGAGDSDFVWNAHLAVDYKFSDRIGGLLGYRWLDYDYDNGDVGPNHFAYNVTYEGPTAALLITW